MKSREMKQVGQVLIDSGRIAIVDSGHIQVDLPANCVHDQFTPQGDGVFPVFTFTEQGHEYLAVRLTTFTAAELKEAFMRPRHVPPVANTGDDASLGDVG